MGKVAVLLKIMPEDVEVDLKRVENEIREKIEVQDIGLENIAFGLKAIKVLVHLEDKEGVLDKTIDEIKEIKGVQSVEVDKMDLL